MARKRMLSPEFFKSETVAALPIPTRLTFAGLWVYLDDYGRGKDNPALIKAEVWPLDTSYTERKVASDVQRLAASGSICRYECCGRLLHVPFASWSYWQKISHPTPTRLCPCPEHEPDAARIHREEFRSESGASRERLHANVVKENSGKGSSTDPTARATPSGSSVGSCDHGYPSDAVTKCALCRVAAKAAGQ